MAGYTTVNGTNGTNETNGGNGTNDINGAPHSVNEHASTLEFDVSIHLVSFRAEVV